jgi:hypothetical protein
MPKIDYHNTVIYQLTCPTFNDIYVNYTSNLYVRKYIYSYPAKIRKPLEFQDTIDLHGGFDKWTIIVLEKYPDCKNAADAKKKVEEWVKILQVPPKTSELPPKTSDLPPKTSNQTDCKTCKNCGKIFTRNDNLQRHIKYRCVKQEIATLREELAKKDEELAKKDEEQHKIIESAVREEMKKHMKQMKKQKKQLSLCNSNSNNRTINQQQNNINNNHNNTTINNHNITIELGTEKLSEVFTHKQQKNILEKGYNSLRELIQHVHFNPKYTQFQNLSITNMLGPFGYKYVQDAKDFIIIKKDDLLKELVETRMYDIEEFLENCKGTLLTERKVKTVSDFIEKMEDKKYASEKIKKLLVDVYNLSADIEMKEVMKKVRNAKHTQDELLLDTLAEPPVHT